MKVKLNECIFGSLVCVLAVAYHNDIQKLVGFEMIPSLELFRLLTAEYLHTKGR